MRKQTKTHLPTQHPCSLVQLKLGQHLSARTDIMPLVFVYCYLYAHIAYRTSDITQRNVVIQVLDLVSLVFLVCRWY
jgi:hypothetical protein